jgi:hypothetical protein
VCADLATLVDSSGVRFTLTPSLRRHDVSTLRIGAGLKSIVIPPRSVRLAASPRLPCPASCLC